MAFFYDDERKGKSGITHIDYPRLGGGGSGSMARIAPGSVSTCPIQGSRTIVCTGKFCGHQTQR